VMGVVTTPSRQRRPFLSISIQPNDLREIYVPFDAVSYNGSIILQSP